MAGQLDGVGSKVICYHLSARGAPAAVSAWGLWKAFGFRLMAGAKAKVAKKGELVDSFQLEEDLVTWSSQC